MLNGLSMDELLIIARQLVTALEAKDDEAAAVAIEQITNKPHFDIVHEIGTVVRKSHDGLTKLYSKEMLREVRETPSLSCPKNLDEVMELTHKAANETLDGIDYCNQIVKEIQAQADRIKQNNEAFSQKDISSYVDTTSDAAKKLGNICSSISVAQSFQDLIGQSIRANILTILEIQDDLIRIIKLAQESTGQEIPDDNLGESSATNQGADDGDIDQFLSDLGL